ncbi:MAG: hypothetical protein QFX33_00245 [Candidatus Nezhaarchaeota archaeon]|nr:hypothetical protein [Candidatus Nezhaarchaeota archaeon]
MEVIYTAGRLVRLSLLIAVGLFLASIFPSLASASPPVYHYVGTYDIQGFYVIGPEEDILCDGEVHYDVQLVLDSAGGHWRISACHNLRGVGLTTGIKYQVVSAETRHYNTRYDGSTYEWTYINTSPLISQGNASNMIFTIRNHLTINANGEVTVSFSEVQVAYRG